MPDNGHTATHQLPEHAFTMTNKQKHSLYVFDFDGTLTTRDTLLEFLRFAHGSVGFWASLAVFLPRLLLMRLHLRDNGLTKQQLFAWHFRGMPTADFDALCRRFADSHRHLLRKAGMETIVRAKAEGARVLIVSASVDNWVAPFFADTNGKDNGQSGQTTPPSAPVEVLGTRLEVCDGRLTGRFLTPNCYGAEKVKRLKAAVPALDTDRSNYHITAFGDSRGDKELLEFADEQHYKPFRQ